MFDISKKDLQPISDPKNLIDTKTGEILRIRYALGYPIKYKLDLSKGTFGELKGDNITKESDDIKFIPLAFRSFEDSLFGQPKMKYVEVYFLNAAGWLCQFMLHKHNADTFLEKVMIAKTHDYELGQYGLTIKLKSRTTTTSDGTPATYFVCNDFRGFKLDKEQQQIMKSAFDSITAPVYRSDISNPTQETVLSENWNIRPEPAQTLPEYIAELEREKEAATA